MTELIKELKILLAIVAMFVSITLYTYIVFKVGERHGQYKDSQEHTTSTSTKIYWSNNEKN